MKILWKYSIEFHVLLFPFIIPLLGIMSNVLLADLLSIEGLFLTFSFYNCIFLPDGWSIRITEIGGRL